MKISVVVTVLNEAKTINSLLLGLTTQTRVPAEVIIIDAGSTDDTVQLIKVFQKRHSTLPLQLIIKKGSRSVGRNWGIKLARNEWLALTDAGCTPHRDWLEKLAQKAQRSQADVVAGYYKAEPKTLFQAAVVPYMLVMPDRVDPAHFLPATRSMLIKKRAWQAVSGFDETLVLSEDYDFAHRLQKAQLKIVFTSQAVVSWWPIETLRGFYQTVSGMAEFDARAGVMRFKAYLVFGRYTIFVLLGGIFFFLNLWWGIFFTLISASFYSLWAVWKNIHYLDRGGYYLLLLQLVADLGVMLGTIRGKFTR